MHEYFQLEQYLPVLAQRWGFLSDLKIDHGEHIKALLKKCMSKRVWIGINLHSYHERTFQAFKEFFAEGCAVSLRAPCQERCLGSGNFYEIQEQTG